MRAPYGARRISSAKDAEQYIESLVPASHRDFDLTQIAGDELKGDEWPKSPLRAALAQLPLLGSYRVLLLDSAGDLKKEAVKGLTAYLKNPNPALRLLLLDSRKRLKEEPLKEALGISCIRQLSISGRKSAY